MVITFETVGRNSIFVCGGKYNDFFTVRHSISKFYTEINNIVKKEGRMRERERREGGREREERE